VASISVGGLSEHLLPPRERDVSLLLGAAAEISARLGSTRAEPAELVTSTTDQRTLTTLDQRSFPLGGEV
jgi:hypothetical protein